MQDLRLQELLRSPSPDRSAPARPDAIVVEALAKRHLNGTEAVRGISFHVAAGEVFGGLSPIRQSPCAGELSVQSMAQAAPRMIESAR
jgi:hypothetical protein